MMTQRDHDAYEKLIEVIKYGTIRGQHPRDTNERFWCHGLDFGVWVYPGEFVIELHEKLYIVGMRPAVRVILETYREALAS